MADAMDSKSIVRKDMWVRLPPPALKSPPAGVEGRRQLGCRGGVVTFASRRKVVTESLPQHLKNPRGACAAGIWFFPPLPLG